LVRRHPYAFILVDTGGMGFGSEGEFSAEVDAQIGEAIGGADVLWMMVDAKAGLNPYDEALYRLVQRSGKPH
ncbi:MAG: ribosome biogenesis GTPase Der, partial [Gammaproteobacteria bacterium]|nr:ribosome biogenesis GTPase Der [Gammaproteobacteria bacterium]